jgi:hypothetical protein
MKLGARFTNFKNYNETLTNPMSKDWEGGGGSEKPWFEVSPSLALDWRSQCLLHK